MNPISSSLDQIVELAKAKGTISIAVVAAHDIYSLKALHKATSIGLVKPILIGDLGFIRKHSKNIGFDIQAYEQIETNDAIEAARIAVTEVKNNTAGIVMKGNITTSSLMRVIMNKSKGLPHENMLSHFAISSISSYHKLLAFSDAALNISPNLEEKVEILKNAVTVLNILGVENPKVAAISCIDAVNPKIESSVHAANLTQMNKTGIIGNCTVDGPFALDNAISRAAAVHKNISSPIAGDADLLLMPNIDAGNVLYKSLRYFSKATIAAIITGADTPIVLTSRADDEACKFYSIALAVAVFKK